jgi:hypothetical protein
MKKLITLLLVLVTLNGYSQLVIDNEKIENLCLEYSNSFRDTIDWRYSDPKCKKAADMQLQHIIKINKPTHNHSNPNYRESESRYDLFHTEKIKVKSQNEKGYVMLSTQSYKGEVVIWLNNYSFNIDSTLETRISKKIIDGFMDSPGHKHDLLYSLRWVTKSFHGYFSTDVKVLKIDKLSNKVYLRIYCVGVFGKDIDMSEYIN